MNHMGKGLEDQMGQGMQGMEGQPGAGRRLLGAHTGKGNEKEQDWSGALNVEENMKKAMLQKKRNMASLACQGCVVRAAANGSKTSVEDCLPQELRRCYTEMSSDDAERKLEPAVKRMSESIAAKTKEMEKTLVPDVLKMMGDWLKESGVPEAQATQMIAEVKASMEKDGLAGMTEMMGGMGGMGRRLLGAHEAAGLPEGMDLAKLLEGLPKITERVTAMASEKMRALNLESEVQTFMAGAREAMKDCKKEHLEPMTEYMVQDVKLATGVLKVDDLPTGPLIEQSADVTRASTSQTTPPPPPPRLPATEQTTSAGAAVGMSAVGFVVGALPVLFC